MHFHFLDDIYKFTTHNCRWLVFNRRKPAPITGFIDKGENINWYILRFGVRTSDIWMETSKVLSNFMSRLFKWFSSLFSTNANSAACGIEGRLDIEMFSKYSTWSMTEPKVPETLRMTRDATGRWWCCWNDVTTPWLNYTYKTRMRPARQERDNIIITHIYQKAYLATDEVLNDCLRLARSNVSYAGL